MNLTGKSCYEGPDGNTGVALLGAGWGEWLTLRVGNFTPGNDPIPVIQWKLGGGPVWKDEENLAHSGIRSADRAIPVLKLDRRWVYLFYPLQGTVPLRVEVLTSETVLYGIDCYRSICLDGRTTRHQTGKSTLGSRSDPHIFQIRSTNGSNHCTTMLSVPALFLSRSARRRDTCQ